MRHKSYIGRTYKVLECCGFSDKKPYPTNRAAEIPEEYDSSSEEAPWVLSLALEREFPGHGFYKAYDLYEKCMKAHPSVGNPIEDTFITINSNREFELIDSYWLLEEVLPHRNMLCRWWSTIKDKFLGLIN